MQTLPLAVHYHYSNNGVAKQSVFFHLIYTFLDNSVLADKLKDEPISRISAEIRMVFS
jgi:hypothetical protein